MSDTTFTFRVEDSLKREFTGAAKAQDRTSAQLLREFMRDYVKNQKDVERHDQWFREEVQLGLVAAESGDLIPNDQVEKQAAEWRARQAIAVKDPDA